MVIDNIQEDLTTQNNVEVQEGKKFHEYIILILELLKFVKRAKMRKNSIWVVTRLSYYLKD